MSCPAPYEPLNHPCISMVFFLSCCHAQHYLKRGWELVPRRGDGREGPGGVGCVLIMFSMGS